MYIDADVIIKIAAVIAALGTIIGGIIAVYKVYANIQKQSKIIESMQKEQKVICRGLRGALQGLIEKGCNGPCKEALALLDDYLNEEAHNG